MRKLLLVTLCTAILLAVATTAGARPQATAAKVRNCGTIKVPINDIQVQDLIKHDVLILSGNVSCKKAKSVVRVVGEWPAYTSVEGYSCKIGKEDLGHTCTKGSNRIEDKEA